MPYPYGLGILIMGLPALIISLVFSLIGVITKRASLVLVGAILIAPFSWNQAWYILILAVPLILVGVSIAIQRKLNELAWILYLLIYLDLASWILQGLLRQ